MRIKDLTFRIPTILLLFLATGCGGGGDEFSQPTKQLGAPAQDDSKGAEPAVEKPAAPPVEQPVAPAAPKATAPDLAVAAAAATPAPEGGGLGLFDSTEPAPAAPMAVDGIEVPAADVTADDGLAADLAEDGRLLAAERGGGRLGIYEVNRRINLMSLAAAENNIRKLSFDSIKGLITAILPSGKIQVWKYQSTLGLDKFAKESIAADSFLRGFEGHAGGTLDLAVSPTRDEMATVGADGQLRFWRVNDGTSSRSFERSGTELQNLTASAGGAYVAAMTGRGVVTIWETSSGKARTLPVGDRAVTCLALESKGSLLAAGDATGNVVVLDVSNGRTEELSVSRLPVADVRFEEESQRLFAIAKDGETRAWNLPLSSSKTMEGVSATGGLLAVSSDMKRVAVPGEKGGLRTIAISGEAAVQELSTGLERITAVAFADEDSVVVGSENGQIEIQESTGLRKLIATNGAGIKQLDWSAEGALATLDKQGNAVVWNVGGSRTIAKFSDETVVASASDIAGAAISIAFQSGKQVVVDFSTGETIAIRQSDDGDISSVALDFQRGVVAFGHSTGKVSVWQFRQKPELITLGQHAAAVTQVRIAESGEYVYAGAADGTVCNWPTQIHDIGPIPGTLPGKIRLAAFASQQPIGVISTDAAIFVMDLRTGVSNELTGLPKPARLRIAPDGSRFAVLTPEGLANIYDTVGGVLLRQHAVEEQVVDVAFQNIEKTCLTLHRDGAVRRWSQPMSGLTSISESLKGAHGVWLNPTGSILAVAAESKLIRFLSVAEDYKLLSTVTVESGVKLLAWTGDQSCAVTSPGNKSVFLVELQGGRIRKTLVDLPAPATQFCRRADNGELLAICGTRLVKVRPAAGDIRVNDISFKASDRDQIVTCGKITLLLSGGRIFRVGRDDKVVIDERVAGIKSLSGSVSAQSAVVVTESGNMLAFSDDKFTDCGVNPLPDSTVTISDDGQYLWIQPQVGEGLIWSVEERKSLQKVSLAGTPGLRSWLPKQRALIHVDSAGSASKVEELVTLEWSTGVSDAQSLTLSPGGGQALIRTAGENVVVMDLATRQVRSIEIPAETIFLEISDDNGTVVAVGGTGKVQRITVSGVETQQLESSVKTVSMDRVHRTLMVLLDAGKHALLSIDKSAEIQMLPNDQSNSEVFSTSVGYLFGDGMGKLKFAERGVQSSGTPRLAHKGGCTGIVLLPNQVVTSGRDGVIRSWSPDLANQRDLVSRGRAIVSLSVTPSDQILSACDELGEALIFNQEGTVVSTNVKIGLGPGSRTFGHDRDRNLLLASQRQVVRFRTDGTPRDGVQFRDDCVDSGRIGETGKRYVLLKNGSLFGFDFVQQRHSIQRTSMVSGLHWTSSSQLAVASGKQIEIISGDGSVVASTALTTDVVASGVSPNGQHLAVLTVSGELTFFETKSLIKAGSFRPGASANRIAVGLAGESVLLYGIDSAEEWSAAGTRLRSLPVSGINSAAYVDGTPFLLTALKNGEVRQWPRQQVFSSRPSITVKDARLLPKGSGVLLLDDKGFVSAESAEKKSYWKTKEPALDLLSISSSSSSSSDGVRVSLLTGANGVRHVVVYDQTSGFVKEFDIPANCRDVQLSSDGASLLLNLEKSVEVRNIETGLVTQSLNIETKRCLYLTPNSVLFPDIDGVLRVAGTGEIGTMAISSGQGTAVAFNETGDLLATGTTEGIITLWDRTTPGLGKLQEFNTESPVRQIILRGSLLIARTDLAAVSIWMIDSKDPVSSGTLSFTHRGVPQVMELDRKQELLATANSENEVSVWDLSTRGTAARHVLSFTGNERPISALAFTETSDSLVSLDASGIVSISRLPDISVLRQRAVAEVMPRESSGSLEELPLSLPGSERIGDDALSRRLRQEDSVRRDLQALRVNKTDSPETRLGDRRTFQDLLTDMGLARSSQVRGLYQDQLAKNGITDREMRSGGQSNWTPPSGIVEDFQKVRSLPAAIAEASTGAGELSKPGEGSYSSTAEGLVRELVTRQRSFVKQMSGSTLQTLGSAESGLPIDQKALEAFRQQLELLSDSRAVQTIVTDYKFPDRDEADAIRVPLQVSSDGSTVAASFPPLFEREDSKGYLDVWDTLSGIPLKQFEIDESVQQLILSASEDHLLTMPAVYAYPLFDNGAPRYLTHAGSVAWCRSPEHPVVAFSRRVASQTQDRLLAIYDARTMDNLPVAMPEGFNTSARSMAFGTVAERFAVSISEQRTEHKLFLCGTSDLSRFEVLTPIDVITSGAKDNAGFLALAFSPDDQTLVAVTYEGTDSKEFSLRVYVMRNEKWLKTTSMRLPEKAFSGEDDRIAVHFVAQTPRVSIVTNTGVLVGDLNPGRKKRSDAVWGIPLSPESTRTVKLSDDGRWLAIGRSNGTISIHDLNSSDPTLSVSLPAEGDTAHDGPVIGLSFSRPMKGTKSPTYLASFGRENRLKVWALIDLEEQFARARKAR